MNIYINSILFPIKTLGPGNRIGIWFQGCSIRCKGCMSKHTWEKEEKYLINIKNILEKIKDSGLKRITISGGEPFEQPEELKELLIEIKKLGIEDTIIYSGLKKENILKNFPWIKELCGLLISEPFEENKPSNFAYKGSENQIATVFKNVKSYQKFLKEKRKKIQVIGNTIIGIY